MITHGISDVEEELFGTGDFKESSKVRHIKNEWVKVRFSQLVIQITLQIHIPKFEILHFPDNSSEIKMIRIFSVQKSVPLQSKGKIALWNRCHSDISRI
jgi:hypothetical protein